MLTALGSRTLLVALFLLSGSVFAQFSDFASIEFNPSDPVPGEVIDGEFTSGCFSPAPNSDGLFFDVSSRDGVIYIDLVSNFLVSCSAFPVPFTFRIPGQQAAVHPVIISLVDSSISFPADESERRFSHYRIIRVGAGPIEVSALSLWAVALMISVVAALALFRIYSTTA